MNQTKADKPALESLILDDEFQNTLKNLANHFIGRYSKFSTNGAMINRHDLISEGIASATTVYSEFDPSKGVLFKTFAYPYCKHAMDSYCRRFSHPLTISEKASRRDLPTLHDVGILRIDQQIYSEEGEFDIPGSSGIESSVEVYEFAFKGLSPIHKKIAFDRFVNDMTIDEIARRYEIPSSTVFTILKKSKQKIQNRMENYEQNV